MHDDDVPAIVIDNGSGICKAGFSGDESSGEPCFLQLLDDLNIR